MKLPILPALLALVLAGGVRADETLARDLGEEVLQLPVRLPGGIHAMTITVYHPSGPGPHPLAVLSHGRATTPAERARPSRVRMLDAARYFVRKGFVVIVPTRQGYGASAGGADPEDSGPCRDKDYADSLRPAVSEILAALDYGRRLDEVDSQRMLLLGQSVGGISTVAAAAENPPGVMAAINFAGGAGGDPASHPGIPCAEPQLRRLFAEFGAQSRTPMLWVYTRNDHFFGPEYTQEWARAYREAGARLDYRLLPAFGDNGHLLFADGPDIWMPLLEAYLGSLGFRQPDIPPRPAPSGFAALNDSERIPYLKPEDRRDAYARFLSSPFPRAFAISPDGHWGYAHGGDAAGRALGFCQNHSPSPCSLYAVDQDVVWPGGQP
ncbi:alpha/beta hydrolase family protein [Chromobacterium subtsugae]|uniref:alpha/beta hydrolase family protein n=1 Tax=Chromobacterium subtsugae TaxID=251747 RepID=UPI0007F8C747|nr:dienelactone hydrolase family protein [Chromobacterium subtsugae]